MSTTSGHSRLRYLPWLVVGAMTLTAACGEGGGGGGKGGAVAGSTTTAGPKGGSEVTPTKLDLDPCSLLTIPEMEAAIGPGVERGGGVDTADSCGYSIGGDIGAGGVGITNGDPLLCAAIQRGLDSGTPDGASSVRVDVGGGGFATLDSGIIQFVIGGGCISISAGKHGRGIDQAALLTLAKAAAGRVG